MRILSAITTALLTMAFAVFLTSLINSVFPNPTSSQDVILAVLCWSTLMLFVVAWASLIKWLQSH